MALILSPEKCRTMTVVVIFAAVMLCVQGDCVAPAPTIHEVLRSKGLPAGLLPEEVRSYRLSEEGRLEVFLAEPCLAKFENRVMFEREVRGNLSFGSLVGVEGLSQEELFLWLPVKDIVVENPRSGVILFDFGVAFKQLSFSLFEVPPKCRPQGVLKKNVIKDRGFEARR